MWILGRFQIVYSTIPHKTRAMDVIRQVRRPSYATRGDSEYAFFAVFRDPVKAPTVAQATKYHSFGGYLFRGITEPDSGDTLSVFVECGGPDSRKISEPGSSRVGEFWTVCIGIEFTMVHPSKWGELGITDEVEQNIENVEEISRICSVEIPEGRHYTRSIKHKFDLLDVEKYRGNGLWCFARTALIQNGVLADAKGNFVVHFRLSLGFESSDNEGGYESDTGSDSDKGKSKYHQMRISDDAVLDKALKMRTKIVERMVEYDGKLKSIRNEVVLGILRKEMELLSNIVNGIPELCDYV